MDDIFQQLARVMDNDIADDIRRAKRGRQVGGVMRECWMIEEQETETEEWFAVEVWHHRWQADESLRRWNSTYPRRVVRYVPADTLAMVAHVVREEA